MGAFKGGDNMKRVLDHMAQQLGSAKSVRVGFLEGSTCGENNDASAPEVAFYNEYGTVEHKTKSGFTVYGGIPARPFFRIMIQKNSPMWGKLVQAALRMSDYNTKAALSIVGMKMHEQLQQSIEEFTSPGNAPSTIAAKGFDKPLEDSKNMKRAVWFEVSK